MTRQLLITRKGPIARKVLLAAFGAAVLGAASLSAAAPASANPYGYGHGYGYGRGYGYAYRPVPPPRYGFHGPRHRQYYGRPWWAHRGPPPVYGYGYGWR